MESGWQRFATLKTVTLIDGSKDSGVLMRRKNANGEWEYRRLTPAEIREAASGREL